ncbi:MAG TPA: PLP-dependent aspartate aminotransferase family protein [Opitutaceae bacterium]|nr:PLP-dependent aspartate aminotransferase family protein [Opitutaceae bacterium]
MSPPDSTKPSTAAAQALGYLDPATGAFVPPIQPATTYERGADNRLLSGRLYSRPDNPNYEQAEALLSRLEGGAATAVFSSGMSAATAVFLALRPGDHVLVPSVIYWALRNWLVGWATDWGLRIEQVDMTEPARVAAAVRPGETRLVWIETPANPTLAVTDIAALALIAHGAGAILAVDSTFATPIHTRPLSLGADLVMHSATKYLNGHSDVVAGSVTTDTENDTWQRIKAVRSQAGAVLGPFEAWLLLRGMRTLFVRVPAQSRGAQRIAEHFQRHPRIEEVLYPGLPAFPGHGVAARQMQGGFGGMLSLRVKGGAAGALAFIARLRLWKRATSLGGVESLIEHRASVEGPQSATPADLLRLSVGLEDTEDLILDLERALD